jgi:hypothetical protein
MIRRMIRKIELHELERDIINILHKTDRRSLIILLLIYLPNLTLIYVHIPESDEILSEMLK